MRPGWLPGRDQSRAAALHRAWEHFEAQLTEPALCENEGHPALKEMGRKFSRRSGPAKAGAYFAWLQDGGTAEEEASLRAPVPGPVVAVLTGALGRGYRRNVAPVWRS